MIKTAFLLSDPVNPVSRLSVRLVGIIKTVKNHDTAVDEGEPMTRGLRMRDQIPNLIVLKTD